MQENSNKILLFNSIILYSRLAINSLLGLFATRYSLQALGVIDYGLYSVLGSIVTFIAIINTIMVSSSHRFIAVAIGKGVEKEVNTVFNICFVIHTVIAISTLLLAIPLGEWYINSHLNYEGDIRTAVNVFNISVAASAFSFIGVPYYALLMAKEKFLAFSIPDIISHILRLGIAILLLFYFEHKLIVYALAMAVFTAYPTVVYIHYCRKHYSSVCFFRLVRDFKRYKEIMSFSAWVAYGAVAYVGKTQSAALVVNTFFTTVMNTALGIAGSVNSIIHSFAQNIAKPISPQITKSYAAGNHQRCEDLLVLSTKTTYLVMLLVAIPFLVETEWILGLWLGKVPQYAVAFTILVIIDSLIDSLNSGIKEIIYASGNIKLYQILPNTLRLGAIGVAYYAMKITRNPYSVQYVYIGFTIINLLVTQWILNRTVRLSRYLLYKRSYLPSILVTLTLVPLFYLTGTLPSIVTITLSLVYTLVMLFFIGFSNSERKAILKLVKK